MNIDILGQSINLAIEHIFELPEHEVKAIEVEVSELSKYGLDTALASLAGSKETGLKRDLCDALVSGDTAQIDYQAKRANIAAKRGIFITAARQAVTIENGKRIRKRK